MTETQEKIVEWLQRMSFHHVMPVVLLIEGDQYEGAAYTQWGSRRFYLAGDRPQRGFETCYVFENNSCDWHIAAYMDRYDELMPRQQKFHPVGNNWILQAELSNGVSEHVHDPYHRLKVTFA